LFAIYTNHTNNPPKIAVKIELGISIPAATPLDELADGLALVELELDDPVVVEVLVPFTPLTYVVPFFEYGTPTPRLLLVPS